MAEARTERGATLVEYVLLVALIAGVSIGVVDVLQRAIDDRYAGVGTAVGTGEVPPGDESPGGGGGGGGPEPEPPRSTTTAPPVTTTRPVTTTTAPTTASASFGDVESTASWFRWEGSADVRVLDAAGQPVQGARVEVRVSVPGGSDQVVTRTTGADGSARIGVGPYDWWSGVSRVDVAVVSVEAEGLRWDGDGRTATIARP